MFYLFRVTTNTNKMKEKLKHKIFIIDCLTLTYEFNQPKLKLSVIQRETCYRNLAKQLNTISINIENKTHTHTYNNSNQTYALKC